ncbi:LamG-like jellyroll fold domain-containing protein [Paenarthrobacter sp. NCHU4564]|uniref:LamG-like jellyroll fold domain-containing protein n=1 Tax=Paenarthrobacter sp. NCHU4564 TaxID=3451353 RepID=UPI003F9BA4F2
MASSAAFLRRACVPALTVSLFLAGLAVPAAVAGPGVQPAETDPAVVETGPGAVVVEPGSESAAQAEAKASGEKVVVDSATTPTDLTVANPDGTFTRSMSSLPVRMETSAGWVDISTDLVKTVEDGKAVIKPEQVPVDVTIGAGGSNEMAKIDDKEGHSITQSWPFGALPEPVLDGDTATYRQVLPGVDLVQIAHQTGVSQVLKIESAEAARDPRVVEMRLFLDAENAELGQSPEGTLTATGEDTGQIELRTTGGQWWDSSQEGASATDPGRTGLTRPFTLSLGQDGDKQTQVFGMSEILDTPGLQYPLYVDPLWHQTRTSYVFVDTAYPNTSYWNGQFTDSTVNVGYLQAHWAPDGVQHLARTYYQFEGKPFDTSAAIITARLSVLETWSSSCTPTGVASWITGNVSPSTTWNNQPSLTMRTDVASVAKGYSSACPAGTVGFDLMAGKNVLLNSSKWTIMLAAENELDSSGLGWKRFSNGATLDVDYNRNPYGPAIDSVQSGRWTDVPWQSKYVTRITKPKLSVFAGDPDADGGNIQVDFSVRPAAGGANVFSGSVYNTSPAWKQVSIDWGGWAALAEGNYIFESRAYDIWGGISPLMSFPFTVDTTGPKPPVLTKVGTALTQPDPTVAAYTDSANEPGKVPYQFEITNSFTNYREMRASGFIYAVSEAEQVTLPASVTCLTPPTREYIVLCPETDGVVINIGTVSKKTNLSVWAFDAAGNVTGETYRMGSPTRATITVPEPEPVRTVEPLTLSGGAVWKDIVTTQATGDQRKPTGTCGTADATGTTNAKALQLGAGAKAEYPSRAVDTAENFSVAAWVCPTSVNGSIQSLITQLAGSTPGAALEIDENSGAARLQAWTGASSSHIVKGDYPLVAGGWRYVTAVYDKINRQLRLSSTSGTTVTTWVVAASQNNIVSAGSTQKVVIGQGITRGQQFTGKIYRPVLTKGMLTTAQFETVQDAFMNPDGITEKTGLLK